MNEPIRLAEYRHGAGCGCKISPRVLDTILQSELDIAPDEKLLVGNHSRDDAAVYDVGNGIGIISTIDFFMPIVNDPFDFGRIAATNAISDFHAMCDPQTSGGLLIVVTPEDESNLLSLVRSEGYSLCAFGYLTEATGDPMISVL